VCHDVKRPPRSQDQAFGRGKTALVTGAASGIGAATARALRARGVWVVGMDLNEPEDCDRSVICDVGDAQLVAEALGGIGIVDIAITAAGYYAQTDLTRPDADAWRTMLQVHLEGTFNIISGVLPGMYERRSGAICTVASELALTGDPAAPHYAAAKGAIIALTKSIAVEAAPRGVRVNCIAPGPTQTPLLPEAHKTPEAIAQLPLRRLVDPDEIAATVVWMIDGEHNLIGQVISPNAGAVL
jgi:2-hydroxycyclohexanecarboxyl-CoA dehydrogenase